MGPFASLCSKNLWGMHERAFTSRRTAMNVVETEDDLLR
jgi:hypothetical protein